MFEPIVLVYFVLLGVGVGFLAGLLGVGGGAVMVPMLTTIFLYAGVELEHVVHLALGTSMASIVVTSLSSMRAHHQRQGVIWPVVKAMTPGVLLGSVFAMLIIDQLNPVALASFFAFFMLLVSGKMLFGKQDKGDYPLPGNMGLFAVGGGIGMLSTLVSIGGGSLTVPYLMRHNTEMTKAIGTSAALGFPIAIFGMTGYFVLGHFFSDSPVGYISWQAVLAISVTSAVFAPLGAKAAYRLPVKILKKILAILLIGLSIKMLFSVIG